MDRKKLYIIIIILCVAATAGVLYFGLNGGAAPAPPVAQTPTSDIVTPTQTTPAQQQSGLVTEFPPPATFPQSTTIDLSVFESSDYRALTDFTPITIAPEEIGREVPFQDY